MKVSDLKGLADKIGVPVEHIEKVVGALIRGGILKETLRAEGEVLLAAAKSLTGITLEPPDAVKEHFDEVQDAVQNASRQVLSALYGSFVEQHPEAPSAFANAHLIAVVVGMSRQFALLWEYIFKESGDPRMAMIASYAKKLTEDRFDPQGFGVHWNREKIEGKDGDVPAIRESAPAENVETLRSEIMVRGDLSVKN